MGADDDYLEWFDDIPAHVEGYAFAAATRESEALEPLSLAEAKRGPDWKHWEQAIFEELENLRSNGTWDLVEAPEGVNIVGSKWVFCIKKDAAHQENRILLRVT